MNDHLGNNRVVANSSGTAIQKNHYYPFGSVFASTTGAGKQPYKYNGKELDAMHGLNLYDYSARYYESGIGRFTSVDPLAEKYYSWSPYAYCLNNPLRWIDKDGRDPGDPFKTKIEAANDFAKYYNGTSISMNKEFASLIYKNSNGSYSYNVARIGGTGWSIPNLDIPEGTTEAAGIHTHGADSSEYGEGSYKFSDIDTDGADDRGKNEYLITPGGEMLEYDVKSKNTSNPVGAAKDIPSDPNSRKRVNETDAKDTKPHYIDVQYLTDPNRRVVIEHNKPEKK
ncbi:RHS repeat domain-containing protein [Dysgonomonas sp. 521]|uniref:RHS repeat domain-containing protein n=1 Tax=Dysgonomonas sp. 521 TaxID=2302932 RepID=UPI002103F649|nr:DUF4329 domain-containing protein [Dysgonomonas sp. 521]